MVDALRRLGGEGDRQRLGEGEAALAAPHDIRRPESR
jgi:hypothetical protein